MAEVLTTMVVGPLVSMVKEKASSYLLDQYGVMEGMEAQHKLLKRKLPAVLDVITDAEEKAAENREGAKAWLQELREVAYKANDVLDEFKYEALRRKAKKEGHYKELGMDVIKLFPSHNRFVFRYRMGNKLRMILEELDVLIAEMNTFRFEFKSQPQISLKWRQTDPNIPDDSVDIASDSRAKEKEEIVDTLCSRGDNVDLVVLPIVGMGGMGKTTLAQLVYKDTTIQRHFQVRLWLCVSENFDVDSLVELIVKEVEKNGYQMSGRSALEKFKSAVSGKRYLLVLDDIWNRDDYKWEKLKSYLHHGGTGSSVVTTTRDKKIAKFMGTIKSHKIKQLEENSIKKIIETRAFSSQEQRPPDDPLKMMVPDVAKRCSGSPLAATALGSVLRTKNTVQEWKDVLNRSNICDEENGILPILKLSYNCLPPHMRQCFAFCAMFPKDHEIDVEMLIQLWMANCFIPEKKGVCPEVTGQQIFNELAQRSFFQEVKQVTTDNRVRITCKIHDLMHDVAQDSMGKECAALDTELSQSEDFPYTARHLFVSVDISENILNASVEKGSYGFQTLICDGYITEDVQIFSKYCSSVRALKIQQCSFLEPKILHHLRYLDLSNSNIEALPEDITIMYHLQTLNLSNCRSLEQLPMAMKYMTALRHLYTHGCLSLTGMPPNLGHLTSLQTLTCFVVGTDSSCSKMGELEKLDLGGHLELTHLQNTTGADAKAAHLWDKKRLEELTLRWSDDHDKETDKEVLEGLRPHDELKAMRMFECGTSSIPTWMLELQGMVVLKLQDCQNLEKLPALWQLPALQFLLLAKLPNLHCLFSGGAPSKFQELKRMELTGMPMFETWWDTTKVKGEEPLFPKVEYLRIRECGSLTALPKAFMGKHSCGKDDPECRSAFPALREMQFADLEKFHRWEAVEGTLVTFPELEKLEIENCSGITTFPEAPKLSALKLRGCSEEASLQAASRYFHSLSRMSLYTSRSSDCNKEEKTIEVVVRGLESPCPLGDLVLDGCNLFFSHSSAVPLWKCFGQLSQLKLYSCSVLVCWPENLFQCLVSLRELRIDCCSNLTGLTESCGEQSASCGHLPRLESLEIDCCGSLVQVPNQLRSAASLKTFSIVRCLSLKSVVFGEQQEEDMSRRLQVSGQSGVVQPEETSSSFTLITAGSSSNDDESTVSTAVQKTLTSLKTFGISFWESLKSVVFGEQQEEDMSRRLQVSGQSGVVQPEETSSSFTLITAGSSSNDDESTVSTAVQKTLSSSSASSNSYCFFPCLESLQINNCRNFEKVANLPPSIKTLQISNCRSLVTVSGEVPSLEKLTIAYCKSLESLPNGPHQVFSSLRVLGIRGHIKKLPPSLLCLQQRENHLDERDTDRHLQEQVELVDSNPESLSEGASTAVVTSSNHSIFPCLEYLQIVHCDGFTELANLPPSIKALEISDCCSLVSLSAELPSLESLDISDCVKLESLPNGHHQAYSSLRDLLIRDCGAIKQLPPSLQQRLDHLEYKDLDAHLLQDPGVTIKRNMQPRIVSRLSANDCSVF